jgi:hypothetical protein
MLKATLVCCVLSCRGAVGTHSRCCREPTDVGRSRRCCRRYGARSRRVHMVILRPPIVHSAAVNAVAFAPAGPDLVSSAVDGPVASTVPFIQRRFAFLIDATLVPDGSVVVAGGSARFLGFGAHRMSALWTMQAHKSYVVGVHYEESDLVGAAFGEMSSWWTLPQP